MASSWLLSPSAISHRTARSRSLSGQLAAGARAREGEPRALAGGDHQVQLRRHLVEPLREGLVDRSRVDPVLAVGHQDERLRQGGERADQGW